MNGIQERLRCEFVPSVIVPTLTGTRCKNGGCTREIYRGAFCFRCWAGVKWTSMRQRVENKNGNNPSYENIPLLFTKEEIVQWVYDNPPPTNLEEPSIDRIIPEKGYSLDNIRWIEKRINSSGVQRDIPLDKKRCPLCRQILDLDAFGIHNGRWNLRHRQSRCKKCKIEYDRKWREKQRNKR